MNLSQTRLVASHSARFSLRSGVGLVFVLLSLMFGLLVAQSMLAPIENITQQVQAERGDIDTEEERNDLKQDVLESMVEQARPAVSWVLGAPSSDEADEETRQEYREWTDYLLDDRPALLSAILLILLWGWPFIVAVGAFDIVSSDIGARRLRFQLLRVDRSSVFFGRLFGTVITFGIVLTLLLGVVVGYMALKLPFYSFGELALWGAYGWLALMAISLPYIATCSWISAGVSGAMSSLTLCVLVIGGIPLFALIGGFTHDAASYVLYALPWGIQSHLFHFDTGLALLTMLGCLGYTALFVFLGHRRFVTRDL